MLAVGLFGKKDQLREFSQHSGNFILIIKTKWTIRMYMF